MHIGFVQISKELGNGPAVVQKIIKCNRRNELAGSSSCRITFGTVSYAGGLKAKSAGDNFGSSSTNPEDSRSGRGYESARMKMANMREEWAEEEELPVSWEEVDSQGGGRASSQSMNYGKMQHLASTRMNKLKTEKRNSKY